MSKSLQVVVPDRAAEMVASAADRQGCTVAAYVRQRVYAALRADGFDPVGVPANGWGPGQEWAIVDGDSIVALSLFEHGMPGADDLQNGRRLLPVEYADSQPFDPAKHYRLPPDPPRVDGSKVLRVYPIVLKSEVDD